MYHELLLPDLRVMLEENDAEGLEEFCNVFHPAAVAEVLEEMSADDVWTVLSHCSLSLQVQIFEFIDLSRQVELVRHVDRQRLSTLLEEMSPDDRVDVLSRMPDEQVEDLLPLIAQAERNDIRKLLSCEEDTAGSIMTTDYASLPEDITVREALERLRKQAPDRETIYYVYILGDGRRLIGLLSLRELILARPDTRLADIMRRDVISVRVDDDQEDVGQQLARYDFLAIPVVDNQNQLVGIITHDDVLDVMREEATEDAHLQGAVQPLEESYLTTPLVTLTWKRGTWLVVLLFAAFATAAVLSGYEKETQRYEWMVWFIPLVLASGGNAGSQSATLVIRLLAMEDTSSRQNWTIAVREFLLALMLGGGLMLLVVLSLLKFVTAVQAAVVGLTVFLVVLMGTVTGAMLPLGFKRLGMDPALMSNPLIAALVDVLGVVIYYSVAMTLLGM